MNPIVLLILLCPCTTALAQDLDCEKFKNGKFELIDEEYGNAIIERKGKKQTEFMENTGLKIQLKVEWLDACTYTLELDNVLENPNSLPLPEEMILTVKIIETKANGYIQTSTSNLSDLKMTRELVRIK